MSGVFINYRGSDSRSYAVLLHLELSRRYGRGLVFLDSESIPAGADYVQSLLTAVRTAGVLLAVVGPNWLTGCDAVGRRCIDDPQDWIRRELLEAFAVGVRVVPVVIDDAQLPREEQLPDDIAVFARCQYRRLRHRDARADLDRLAAELAVPAGAARWWRIGGGRFGRRAGSAGLV